MQTVETVIIVVIIFTNYTDQMFLDLALKC